MSAGPHHLAARLEDRVQSVVQAGLRQRGWEPLVVPATSYGRAGAWVRALARVHLVPPGTRPEEKTGRRGWRRFVGQAVAGVEVTVRVGDRTATLVSDREGYVDARVPTDLAAGWRTASYAVGDGVRDGVPGRQAVDADVHVVDPATTYGMVSDVDDTVLVTMLPRPLIAFRNAFLRREESRRPVPGMADLYAAVLAAHPETVVVYLSTGAWNTAPALRRFLARHGFPPGPTLLTDWGPTSTGWFRSGPEHKRRELRRLFEELPEVRWLQVGDDGQHDPSLYAEAAAEHPDHVRAVAIRQLSAAEQVASHGTPGPRDRGSAPSPVLGPDGSALARGLRERGLLR